MKRNKILVLSALLSAAGIFLLPQMLNLKGNVLAISNSYFAVFVWAGCWFFLNKAMQKISREDRRGYMAAGILSFLFSLCIAFGAALEQAENVNFKSLIMWLAVFVWTVILTIWMHFAWEWLERYNSRPSEKGTSYESKQLFFIFGILMLSWFIIFLAVYPGFFVYDAQDEFIQVQTRNFTTHHPLPHVLLLGGIVLLFNKLTGSYNMGIAVYTLLQMLVMAGVFTYVLSYMKRKGVRTAVRVLSLFYFAFFPVIVMFVLCSAKDGIFTAALLLLVISLIEMAGQREKFFLSWKNYVFFGASAVVMMMFRHNGMYAFLVMVPIMILYMKGCRKKLAILLGAVFAVYFLITTGLTAALHAVDSENQEILTVPIQQLSRTYKYEKESFSQQDLETLYEIIPENVLPYYTSKVSDGVKVAFNNEAYAKNPGKYISLWIRTGLKHPFTYLNAWFMTSYGFWYPDTVIDVYRGNGVFTFTYEDSSFFGYEVEQPGVRESKIPFLDEWYRNMSLEIAQQKIPVVSMLFSPGFLFWVFAFTFGYTYYRKRYQLLIPLVLILLVWLTVILGPTYLPRYVLILWYALPVLLAVLVNESQLCYTNP